MVGICASGNVEVSSSAGTVNDGISGNEVYSVFCNADGTVAVSYVDGGGNVYLYTANGVTDLSFTCLN